MLASTLAFPALLLALQNPPPLPRAYQPLLLDPHHKAEGTVQGGPGNNGFGNGDMTPDGRLMLAYRRVDLDSPPPSGTYPYQTALTAALVRPERFQLTNGHITSFKDPAGNFVFGNAPTLNGDPSDDEFALIHRGYEFSQVDPSDPDAIDVSGSLFPELAALGHVKLDPDYPIGGRYAGSHITMCLVPNPHARTVGGLTMSVVPSPHQPTGNPYPSDPNGVYELGGQYTTYKLFVVRLVSENWIGQIEASPSGIGEYFQPILSNGSPVHPNGYELVSQAVTVIIDEATDSIHATAVAPYEYLTTIDGDRIEGIEVSMTADGKFILFQGRVDSPLEFQPGDADVAYVYNKDAASSTGWTPVRSITELPLASELDSGMSLEEFKERYRVFKHPIKIATPTGDIAEHSPGDHVRGAYTWISKDGSFFHATCGITNDNVQTGEQSQGPGCRVGNYICGDITGGHIKYIDDTGINPTRQGIIWDWPEYTGNAKDSQRNLVMSLGLKPGLWEGFLTEGGAPMPTSAASQRIPILPLIMNSTDTYGEVRFEEADGDYLLYLACNETLVWNSALGAIGTECHEFSIDHTPDTSGRDERAPVTLNDGAGFPQEAYGPSLTDVQVATGAAFDFDPNMTGERFHENLGFKGQGILLNTSGRIEAVQTAPTDPRVERFMGLPAFSAQMFVKAVMPQPTGTTSMPLLRHGLTGLGPIFTLNAHDDGSFSATIWALPEGAATPTPLTLRTAPGYLSFASDIDDCRDGWTHVAVTYEGAESTEVILWVDGVNADSFSFPLSSTIANDPLGTAYYVVGPGAPGAGTEVTKEGTSFIVDEVGFSRVARTEEEIRRDAHVAPPDSLFTEAPAGVAIPQGLENEPSFWPIGLPHSTAIVGLGRNLFNSDLLSAGDDRSCMTCHDPGLGFAESIQLSESLTPGEFLDFNSPTLLGGLFTKVKTFSGRAQTIEEQVVLPLTDPQEMGDQSLEDIATQLAGIPSWNQAFTATFGSPPDSDNLVDALSAYVLTLNTGNSAFDQEQASPGALTDQERRGMTLFAGKARCIGCHRGASFTDGDFHNIQSVRTSLLDRGAFTGRAREDGALKTPTLRNLSHTGPYFHDGSKETLADVIRHYNEDFMTISNPIGEPDRFLRPLGLTALEIDDLVAFLQSLNGTTPN